MNSQPDLRKFLDKRVERAKRNKHTGAQRSIDLQDELERIAARVAGVTDAIHKKAERSDSPDNDEQLANQIEQTISLLTDEMMALTAIYHRQSDITVIKRFLSEQRDAVHAAIKSADADQDSHIDSLDARIVELHHLMALERKRIKRAVRVERTKFYVSVSIALVSLALSIYALWFRD